MCWSMGARLGGGGGGVGEEDQRMLKNYANYITLNCLLFLS